jgi:hypothetical protein
VALDQIRERRARGKQRSKDIFEPLHDQLVKARTEISACERANSVNFDFWNKLNTSGRVNEIPSRLHRPLRDFYSETIPNYEAAWKTVNEQAVQSVLESYSAKFGVAQSAAELGFEAFHRFQSGIAF